MDVDGQDESDNPHDEENVLDTVEGEIHFFRAISRARPLGVHRHFHVMCIQHEIEQGLSHPVSIANIWDKLKSCYNMEALEALEDHDTPGPSRSHHSTPLMGSPSPGQNLARHTFFLSEFTLPEDPFIDSIIATRRLHGAGSAASSPMSGPPRRSRTKTRARKRSPSIADMAGLVSGDSDSSALTQESGDEDDVAQGAPTPRSVVTTTATDAGTEGDEDGMDVDDFGPEDANQLATRRIRKPKKVRIRAGKTTRTRTRTKR